MNKINTKRIHCLLIFFSIFAVTILMTSCAKTRVLNTLPQNLEDQVQMAGFENVRVWADKPSPVLDKVAIESVHREIEAYGLEELKKPVAYLAISGGGENGAFGSGLLNGWSASGTRNL
jgi:hypothetical protein